MTDDDRTRRVSQNEILYRKVNEQINDTNVAFGAITGDFSVICECGSIECQEQISVPPEVYERVRHTSTHFLVKPGHEIEEFERVVERTDEYLVVEKLPGEPHRAAVEADPRR